MRISPKSYLRFISKKLPKMMGRKKNQLRKSKVLVPRSPGTIIRKGSTSFGHANVVRGRVGM